MRQQQVPNKNYPCSGKSLVHRSLERASATAHPIFLVFTWAGTWLTLAETVYRRGDPLYASHCHIDQPKVCHSDHFKVCDYDHPPHQLGQSWEKEKHPIKGKMPYSRGAGTRSSQAVITGMCSLSTDLFIWLNRRNSSCREFFNEVLCGI